MPTLDEMREQGRLFETTGIALRPMSRPTSTLAGNGKTCRDCKHAVRRRFTKTYYKCRLTQARWTRGPGTDIRLKDPACGMFEEEVPA